MLFTIEKEYDDIIFNQCSNFEQNKSTKYDYRYNETMFKTHMFKTFSRECYCMVDGVPLTIPYDREIRKIAKHIPFVDDDSEGVYIVKSYTFKKLPDIRKLIEYWETNDMLMTEDIVDQIQTNISIINNNIVDGNRKITYRIVDFISYSDLLLADRYNRLINGTVSLEIKRNYEYRHRDNTLTLKLNGDGGTKWLVIGDKVIGLQTNKKHLKDTLTVKHSNSNSEVIQLDKLIDFNIFDTYEEANYNTNAANLKRDKVALEYEKIKYDEKKLISDHIQNEMKNEYNRFTTEIGYKTEVLKLLISENSLYSNELSTSKSNLDFTLKALTGIEGIAIKLIKELF